MTPPIAPCLWFEGNNAVEAVNFYVSVFKDSKVLHIDRYSDEGPDPDAPVVFIEFQINGQPFQAINAGPMFTFNEAISFSVECADQAELDYYWDTLIADGGETSECGWLKDKYGVSWQVVPKVLNEMMRSDDKKRAGQAMRKMLTMQKLNVAELEAAYNA
jgi:predicted 3-demethylubiquinone-9 3-methyltransferase (glyoxalase superfamily)